MRMADHAEQRLCFSLAVHYPLRVENLVAAMFGIGLRKHHQFDVGRIARHAPEILQQIVDLVVRQRQSHVQIGAFERSTAPGQQVDRRQWLGGNMLEQLQRSVE